MAINYSYRYENEKRSGQKTNPNLTKVDHSGRFWPGQKAFFRSYPNVWCRVYSINIVYNYRYQSGYQNRVLRKIVERIASVNRRKVKIKKQVFQRHSDNGTATKTQRQRKSDNGTAATAQLQRRSATAQRQRRSGNGATATAQRQRRSGNGKMATAKQQRRSGNGAGVQRAEKIKGWISECTQNLKTGFSWLSKGPQGNPIV